MTASLGRPEARPTLAGRDSPDARAYGTGTAGNGSHSRVAPLARAGGSGVRTTTFALWAFVTAVLRIQSPERNNANANCT